MPNGKRCCHLLTISHYLPYNKRLRQPSIEEGWRRRGINKKVQVSKLTGPPTVGAGPVPARTAARRYVRTKNAVTDVRSGTKTT